MGVVQTNPSYDYKKIRILSFLAANPDGTIKYNLQNMPGGPPINNREIKIILQELKTSNLIVEKILARREYYLISEDGALLITELKKLKELFNRSGLRFLSALDEPTRSDVF